MKLTFKQIFFSLFLGIGFSALAVLLVLNKADARQAQQQEVISLYKELNDTLTSANLVNLQKILADDFKLVMAKSDTMGKQEWIKNIQKGGMHYCKIDDSKVKPRGDDEVSVTAKIFGEMWDKEGSWGLKLKIETEQKGDQLRISKIVVKQLES